MPIVQRQPRRRVLKIIGAVLGGVALFGGGLTMLATRRPEVALIESNCGESAPMEGKILIAYATRCGSTAEISSAIQKALCTLGATVDVRPVKSVTNLDGYRAVVIGSAVRYGNWLPEATEFINLHYERLRDLPTALFTVHVNSRDGSAQSLESRQSYTAAVHKLIGPVSEAFFAGKIDPATLSWVERLMVKIVKSPVGDLRDWNTIRGWAEGLPAMLKLAA